MTRRISRLPVTPADHPVQLPLGLDGGLLAVLGKRSRAKGKYRPGGAFPIAAKAKAA